jgi:putative DNA primase/helicase
MAANHRPIIRGDDHAIWRRIKLIPFEQTFAKDKQDRSLKEKLLRELPGILNWAVEGCLQWQKIELETPPSIQEATQEYREEMDLLADWMSTHCVLGSNQSATVRELYGSYIRWCETNEVEPLQRRVFGRKLASKGLKGCKIGGQRGYNGIGLTEVGAVYLRVAS